MPGLDSIIGLSSTAEQLFVWGVLQQVITNLMQPYFQAESDNVWSENPLLPLTPAALAGLVVRGHLDEGTAATEAAKSGIASDRFHQLVLVAGNPPGPQALAEALRRGFIQAGTPGSEEPSYLGGISQGDLQNKWADVIKQLDVRLPGPTTAVQAAVRSMVDDGQARRLYELFGGDPSQYDLEFDVTGEGPSPVEAGTLANRGIIPWDGTGAEVTSFAQAVAESHAKNKWTESYRQLAVYLPPPRTVKAMLHEGSIDEATAIKYLQGYGVAPDAIPAYTGKGNNTGVATAKSITEANIVTLYKERGITAADAEAHLEKLGYKPDDVTIILAAADLEYAARLSTATIAAVKAAYLHRHIDRGQAITALDRAHVNATYRDSLLALWDLELAAGVKQLTVKQVLDFWSVGMIDKATATTLLEQVGYSDRDAGLLVAFNDPSSPWNTGPGTQQTSPGG